MDKMKINSKGSVVISTIFVCMIITIVLVSYNNLIYENHLSVQSNISSIKSYYIAESAIDLLYYDLNKVCEEGISEYFEELKDYKTYYLTLSEEEPYDPPNFENILELELLSQVTSLNREVNKPFNGYAHDHSYKITVAYVPEYNIIKADIIGSYLQARKFIYIEYQLPLAFEEGLDDFNLPKIKIRPLTISKVYSGFGI